MAFRQAAFVATALAAGDITEYDAAHRQMGRIPRWMARLLLLADGSDGFRLCALRVLAGCPCIFDYLLAVHIGALRPGLFKSAQRMLRREALY